MILVAGSAGLVGTNFVFDWFPQNEESINSFDKLHEEHQPCAVINCAAERDMSGAIRKWRDLPTPLAINLKLCKEKT